MSDNTINIKYPDKQKIKLTYVELGGIPKYLVTSDAKETIYYLYRIYKDGSIKELKTSDNADFKEVR